MPQWSLVVVEEWRVVAEQETWEALPNIIQLKNWTAVLPPQIATALAGWGVLPTDTLEAALERIRPQWRGRLNR